MKYLGIDFGAKRVGVAVSDYAGAIAFPRVVLRNDDTVLAHLLDLITKEGIEKIVIGDTLSHGGAENPVTAEAEKFAERLKAETHLPVVSMWEMWSSIEASRYDPAKSSHYDAAAAAIILQRYLDIHANTVQ